MGKPDWKPGKISNDYRDGHETVFGQRDMFKNLATKPEEAQGDQEAQVPKPG